VRAREPIGERGSIPQPGQKRWKGMKERERVKSSARIRAPQGPVGEITGHKEMRIV
jgi:hypothetical protein